MLLKSLAVATGLATAATAFLMPPEMVPADVKVDADTNADTIHALPFDMAPKIAQHQTVEVPCQACPLKDKNRPSKFRVKQGVDSRLELVFDIDHQPKHDRLLLNGFELYPDLDPFRAVGLTAPQSVEAHDAVSDVEGIAQKKHHRKPPQLEAPRLGYSVRWHPVTRDEKTGMELLAVDFQINEVGYKFIAGIPNVHVKLIKTADGGLMIGDVRLTESQTGRPNHMDKQEVCTTVICKLRAIAQDRIRKFKPHSCGKAAKMAAGHQGSGMHRGGHHHHHHGGRPGHFRLHEHSWSQLFKKFASHILFPVFVGILAGVTASVIGMAVGTILVGLWRVFVRGQPFFHQRRRHSGHSHHKAAQKEAAFAEEKSGLMAHQETPPTYEEEDNRA